MQKIKIRLPATLVNFSPGLTSLGLALALYTSVEFSQRSDDSLIVDPQGEGAGRYAVGLRHPVVLGMSRVFQRLERAPLGVNIKIDNQIPVGSGLGAETAFLVAGVMGANNLLGHPLTRDQALELAAQISRSDSAVTAVLGGFTASMLEGERLVYRSLPLSSMRVVVVLPQMDNFTRPALVERVPLVAALNNISRIPLFLEALRTANYPLLADTLVEHLHLPRLLAQIPGYAQLEEVAKRAGAAAVTLVGDGPALVIFTENKHEEIASVAQRVLRSSGLSARTWVLPLDTQGILVSIMGSA